MRRFCTYVYIYYYSDYICARAKRDFNELHYIQIVYCLCARKTYLSFVASCTPAVQTAAVGVAGIAGVYVAEGFTVNGIRESIVI